MSPRLQSELKKRDPFSSTEQETVLNLLRTADLFQNRFGRVFREHGLTGSQYNVLRILRGEGKPLPCLEIADRMIQVVPAMTGLVDRLEAQGLVIRRRCTEDRRVVYIDLTEAGHKLLAVLETPVHDMHRQLVGHLNPEEQAELIRLLEKSRESVVEPG